MAQAPGNAGLFQGLPQSILARVKGQEWWFRRPALGLFGFGRGWHRTIRNFPPQQDLAVHKADMQKNHY
jgi:hypothetical protein